MIVKQILLLFSTIILAVIGLPHDLNYKEKYDNLESVNSTPFFDQDKVQSVLKTLRSKEKHNLKPCSRRFNSDSSLDSDQLVQTSSHVVVIPYESLDSNRVDSQKHYAPNKNNVQYFDNGDSYKALLQTKSTENKQESEPEMKSGKNIVHYIRSPKKNEVSVISSYNPPNRSQQKSVDISEEAQQIKSPFKVSKSQHVRVEDAYDTLESVARVASPGYDNERKDVTAHHPSINNHKKVNKSPSLLNHNPKHVRNPTKLINRGQNIDNSLSVQENDENYDAITYALEMEMAERNQNKKYNPQVFKSIAKLLSIYEQNNVEQELPTKARLVVNPSRNILKAQSLKKYDDNFEDTDSIQDNRKNVKHNLSSLRGKFNAEHSPKTYVNRNNVDKYLKSQSLKHNNDNEESISQESNLTEESEESEIHLRLVQNNLRDSHDKNKIKSVIISHKDKFNNQKDRKDTHELQKQLHQNNNSESVKSYEDSNSAHRSGEDSNYFSESEQDLSHELKISQHGDNKRLSSSQSNKSHIVKFSPLIENKKHSFSPELTSTQNLSQEINENSENHHSSPRDSYRPNYDIEDLSESFENKVQKSNSHHQINSPVSKVTTSLKGRKQVLNDDSINLSSNQEEEDSPQYPSSHKSHDEENKSNLSDYQENEDKRVNGRYQYKVQVPEIRVKEKKHLANDQVSNHKSSNENLIDRNLMQEVEENSENYHSSPIGSHRRNYDIDDLSESSENKVQQTNSRYQIDSPVSKVTASPKGRKLLLNDDNINQSSSQEEEGDPNYYSSSHKPHDNYNKTNLSDYQQNEDKPVNGHYQNKAQVPEVILKEKKHLVNDKVSYGKSLDQEADLNVDDSNENSSQKEKKRLIYPISYHQSQPENNDNSQSDDLSESLESNHNNFNQNSQVTASVKSYQKFKKEKEGRPYRSNVSNNHAINNNNKNNLDLSKTQEYVEKNLDTRYQSTVSVPEIIVKDKKHLINDKLSSTPLSSQEIEENENYRSTPQKFQNHDDSQSDNLIESGENIYNSRKASQQDAPLTVVEKKSNLKSKFLAKQTPQYHSTLPDVISPNYDTSEIHKSEGKSSDDGYTQKTSQKIKEIADTISYNNINEEGGNKENINHGNVVDISVGNLNSGNGENFTPIVDISFDHNNELENGYLNNIKDSTCRDRLDLSTDYGQSSEALINDELQQNMETESRTGGNEQLGEDESQSDGECIKNKIKLSKNEILNSASRRFLNNYLEEENQDQEEEEEKADIEDETEETEASEEIVERDVEGSEQQNSESQNSLFDPSIGKGVREFSESRMLLSESSRLVCYACSTLSDPTCWAPDGKTTMKYCQRGHDSCIQRTYEGKDALIMVRDCAVSCEGETVPGLSLKYKTCEVCHSDLCNSAYTALKGLNLMVMLGVITFVKIYVF